MDWVENGHRLNEWMNATLLSVKYYRSPNQNADAFLRSILPVSPSFPLLFLPTRTLYAPLIESAVWMSCGNTCIHKKFAGSRY